MRDLLTGNPVRDVDLVVEADAAEFARDLAGSLSASLRVHPRFGTAVLTLPDGRSLDVASTRRETYVYWDGSARVQCVFTGAIVPA